VLKGNKVNAEICISGVEDQNIRLDAEWSIRVFHEGRKEESFLGFLVVGLENLGDCPKGSLVREFEFEFRERGFREKFLSLDSV